MSSYNAQSYNFILEEPSESRGSAKGFRNPYHSQSPKNSLRNSATQKSNIFSSPQTNTRAQPDFNSLSAKNGASEFGASPNGNYPASFTPPPGSANKNLTVDFLLQKVDDLLKQSQTPVKPQSNQQARQEVRSYSQANPFGQNPSITNESGKPRKNDIFVKKGSEAPRDSDTIMTSPAKDLQSFKPVIEKQTELFPIRESLRNSSLRNSSHSVGPVKSPITDVDIQADMGEIRSKLIQLENQINAVGSSQYKNSTYNDSYVTPRSQSIPPLRTDTFYTPSSQPAQQFESIKKSPYIGEDYLSYSVEKPKSQPAAYVETNPKKDAEVSEQICQTIDHLIQTHLLRDRSPSKSTLMSQRSYYTSPTRQPYDPASTNSLYKSSILPREEPTRMSSPPLAHSYINHNAEPIHKSAAPQAYSYQSDYLVTEPAHKSTEPLLPTSTYKSTYEPYSVYESRYNYEPSTSKYEPYRPYEPVQSSYEYKSTYEPLPTYETKSRYDPLPSSYDPVSTSDKYGRDLKNSTYSSSYTHRPLGGNYDGSLSSRTRPKYVRPLHRNSPPKYDSQNNWSASGSKYTSPHDNDYFNKNHGSGLSTPKRENPYSHQDSSSTDRKMKKLTLKSKVSEDKDYEGKLDLPRQSSYGKKEPERSTYGKKEPERSSYKSSDLLPDWEDEERRARAKNRQNFKSSELMSDEENQEDISLRATKKGTITSQATHKVKTAPTQAPVKSVSQKPQRSQKQTSNTYKAGTLESDTDHTPRVGDSVGDLVDDSEGEEWEEREDDLATERQRERERVREKAKEYEREQEREKERQRVKELERQRMRQSQKVTRNVPDDGKSWNMVHKLPSSVFEDAENSFDFDVTEPKQRHETEVDKRHAVRASNTVKPKPTVNQASGKTMIWAMDQPVTRSQGQSMTDLSESMRRTQKKPAITHVFDKSGRHGY